MNGEKGERTGREEHCIYMKGRGGELNVSTQGRFLLERVGKCRSWSDGRLTAL
jgi:hypothetical protein